MGERRQDYSVTSFYCHCGTQWESDWECVTNDECPECGAEIEPYAYSQGDDWGLMPFVTLEWVPEGGLPAECETVEELDGWPVSAGGLLPRCAHAPNKSVRIKTN